MATAAPALPTFLRLWPASPFLLSPCLSVPSSRRSTPSRLNSLRPARPLFPISAVEKTNEAAAAGEGELEGMPPEFYDEEWQAHQRERTKEWHAYRQKEEAEEERITNEYREIGMRLKAYPQEEVRKARILVSSFIRAGEDVEKEIEKAAERGELTELILMVIWNRLDVARRDDERDAIRSLDLLYRRVETEILKSEATPAMILLNELLNLHNGGDNEKWLKKCRKRMLEVFPREDPFTVVFPAGFNMENVCYFSPSGLPISSEDSVQDLSKSNIANLQKRHLTIFRCLTYMSLLLETATAFFLLAQKYIKRMTCRERPSPGPLTSDLHRSII